MSVEFLRYTIYVWAILFFVLMAWLSVVFAIHFFVPKAMLQRYFKEPYFSPAEIEFFTGFPFGYIRTAMFMRLSGWPSSGARRGLTDAYKLAPVWFRMVSKAMISILLIDFTLFLLVGIFLLGAFFILGYL